eukprot:1816532-Pleurochrysis_carterae.AAC.1
MAMNGHKRGVSEECQKITRSLRGESPRPAWQSKFIRLLLDPAKLSEQPYCPSPKAANAFFTADCPSFAPGLARALVQREERSRAAKGTRMQFLAHAASRGKLFSYIRLSAGTERWRQAEIRRAARTCARASAVSLPLNPL